MAPTTRYNPEKLAEFCKERIGEGLRWVGVVESGDLNTVYFREATKQQYTRQKRAELLDAFERIGAQFDQLYTYSTPLGQKEAVVLSFRNAHIFQFSLSENRSVVISVDRRVGQGLSTFIEKCWNELFDSSPPDPEID